MKKGLPVITWILLGLMLVAGGALSLGSNKGQVNPVTDEYGPSGLAALFHLLLDAGYNVRIDTKTRPKLTDGEVAVVPFENIDQQDNFDRGKTESTTMTTLKSAITKGQKAVFLSIRADTFEKTIREKRPPVQTERLNGTQKSISNSDSPVDWSDEFPSPSSETIPPALWKTTPDAVASLIKLGEGEYILFHNGDLATNYYLDKVDNATVVMDSIATIAPPGTPLVIVEGNIKGEEMGFLEQIGKWVETAWYQCLFVVAVLIFSLGFRFGLPEVTRYKQKGARELVDAMGDTFMRAKAVKVALDGAVIEADARIRMHLKLPRDASPGERNRLQPATLSLALAEATTAANNPKTPPNEALKLIQRLDTEVNSFLKTSNKGSKRS